MQVVRRARRIAVLVAAILFVPLVLAGAFLAFVQTGPGRATVIWAAETFGSSDAMTVRIGALDGAIPFDMTVRDVSLADPGGVWLSVDRARLDWSPLALVAGVLSIRMIDVDTVDLARLPAPSDTPKEDTGGGGIPSLPFQIALERLSIGEIALGEPVLGTPAAVTVEGYAEIGNPADGLAARLDIERIDGVDGRIAVNATYRPQDSYLGLDLSVDEPAGGLVSRLSGMPGLPPLSLAVRGEGPVDDWTARLSMTAGVEGAAARADGRATIRRQPGPAGEAGRALTVDLAGDLAGLLQPGFAPLAEGRTTLTVDSFIAESGPVTINTFEALTAAGLVSLTGTVDPSGPTANITYDVVAGQAERFAAVLPVLASWRGIEATGSVDYGQEAARVAVSLAADGLVAEGNAVANLEFAATADARGPVADPDTRIAVEAEARASGLRPADASLSAATGETAHLSLSGTATPAGRLEAEPLRLVLGAGEIVWTGVVDTTGIDGKLGVDALDLSTLAGLSGQDLKGIANLDADIRVALADGGLPSGSVSLKGDATDFASGIAQVDGALGDSFTIAGGAERDSDGGFAFDDLTVKGAALDLTAKGSATRRNADVVISLDLPDLEKIEPRVTGAATIDAKLTGSLEDLGVDAVARVDRATAMGRPISGLTLEANVSDVLNAPDGAIKLAGTVDSRAVSGSGRIAPLAAGGIDVQDLDVAIGSVMLTGAVSVDSETRAQGQLALKAGDLSDLTPLTLMTLAGRIDADVKLEVVDGVQVVDATARAANVAAGDIRVGSLDLTADIRDPTGTLQVDADVTAKSLLAGGQRIDSLALKATGGLDENKFSLNASGLGAGLTATGGLALSDGDMTLRLAEMTLSGGGQTGTLDGPAVIRLAGGDVSIDRFRLRTGGGSLDVSGKAGETLDLTVAANALPLSLADIAVPGTGLAGTLSANAKVSGSASAPAGTYDVRIAGLSLPQMTQAGLGSLGVTAKGTLASGRSSVDARITGEQNAAIAITGSVPLSPAGALDLAVRGRLDLALLNDMLAASGDRVSGPIDIDMKIGGTTSAPNPSGTIRLSGGSYSSPLNGMAFSNIAMEAQGGLRAIEVTRLSATTPNGGTISGSGRVNLDTAAGLPAEIRIQADNAQVMQNDVVDVVVDAALSLTGPVAIGPSLAGTVTIRQMDIDIPDRLPSSVRPIPVEHINTPPALQAQFDEERRFSGEEGGGAGYVMALDLTVNTTNRIFVRGMGIDAQLGGSVQVRGTTETPIVVGGFQLRRGYVDVIGQRIDFTRGVVTFTGAEKIDPQLDFVAETTTSSVTAIVNVTGPASNPRISLSSSPELPEDEVLAHVLFDKATGQLTAGEAVQLAQAAASLTGFGGSGPGLVDNIRKNLGLDVLELTSSGDDPAIGVGRYINDNIYLGVKQGARADSSRVTVDVDITDNIRARGEVGADGSTSLGINMEWDY